MSNSTAYSLPPTQGFVVTHFFTVADVKRSAEFYVRVLGGTVVRSGEPTIIQLANSWLMVNVGGGPTDEKPTVTLRPPHNPHEVSSFLNIRVADIMASYEQWRARGPSSSPSQRTMLLRSAATCVILTATSSRLGKPQLPGALRRKAPCQAKPMGRSTRTACT